MPEDLDDHSDDAIPDDDVETVLVPVLLEGSAASIQPGDPMTFTLTVAASAPTNEPVNISCNDATAFSSLPAVVYVRANRTTAVFAATVSATATPASVTVTASTTAGSTSANLAIQNS